MKFEQNHAGESGLRLSGLYAILDFATGTSAEESQLITLARELLAGGGRWFQLRAKQVSAEKVLHLARHLRPLCEAAGAKFIINDRMDIALASGAHGVHLGQTDLPPEAARKIAPPGFLVGLSTHTPEQVRGAAQRSVDYIGFGPIFPTQSKADAQSAKGVALLREVRCLTELPIVAIGGIEIAHASEILAAGANAVAMIGALQRAETPQSVPRELRQNPKN